jgi:hypothetical protein
VDSCDIVDERNPAPVDCWFIPFFIRFQSSKVVQDFFHPQYDQKNVLKKKTYPTKDFF